VVATKIHEEDERKFIDIQSIESMVEPSETIPPIGERVTIPSGHSIGE
jgi:hypothetical protein